MAYLIELIVSVGAQVIGYAYDRGIAAPSSARRRYDPPGAACLVSSADRCSVSSVRGVCALPCVVCFASSTACPAARYVQAVRVRWGLGSPPAGYTGSAGSGVGHARDKIFQRKSRFSEFVLLTPTPPSQNETYLIVQVSKFSEKYKKAPFGA